MEDELSEMYESTTKRNDRLSDLLRDNGYKVSGLIEASTETVETVGKSVEAIADNTSTLLNIIRRMVILYSTVFVVLFIMAIILIIRNGWII